MKSRGNLMIYDSKVKCIGDPKERVALTQIYLAYNNIKSL